MRTSANDSVKDPRTTAITVNEEPLPKEEFEFRSQTKIERALKTLQRLSGLTTLLSTYQLVPMTLTLLNNPSSFNLISTSLAATSLILSLVLAFWSTKVLKNEQSRHLLSQELNWEGVNTGLFVTLLIRAALSLVLIPNMLLQPEMTDSELAGTVNNLSVPLPLIELMVFFVFLSAAKTTFSHIKHSGKAMSSLIFVSNIAMLGSALGLVFSVLRLKAFPFQGDFAMLFPSWNMNGLVRLGTIASFTSFLVWLVNFKRWRVPSVFCTIIVGALVLSFATLSISGYSNAHGVEREHGPEFARPFLGFSNLGMLTAVFGMLTFIGGSYFWRRHYNFIETNRRRNLAGIAVLFSMVAVFAFARGVYWHPFSTSIENGGYSTKTYSPFHAKHASHMTIKEAMLVKYMMNDIESLDQGLKNTANDLNGVITLFENTKRRGFFSEEITTQLWSFTESVDQASEYVPKEAATELFALFGKLDNLEGQLNDAADGVAENTRALKNYALQLWPWSKSLPEESEDFKSILPNSGLVNKLWGTFGSLNKVQDSIEDTKLQLANTRAAYKDAQRTALQTQAGTTELWPWSHKLNVNNSSAYKELIAQDGTTQLWWIFSKVSTLHGQLKDASQRLRGVKKEAQNATTALWPSRDAALADYRNFIPVEQQIQLWSFFNSADEVETSLDNVNNQIDYAQGVYTDAQDKGLVPENAELWSIWANSPRNYATHKEVFPNATQTLWSLFGSVNKSEQVLATASEKAAKIRSSIEDAKARGVLPSEKTVEAWGSHWQDSLPQRFMTQTWTSGWHDLTDKIPNEETTQAWGDHWSVVDKLPNLRTKTTQLWETNWGEEFPREAATQLFGLFNKVNSLENSINNAKDNVAHTQGVFTDAQNKGLLSGKLPQEELQAFWSLFSSANELKSSVEETTQQINEAQTNGLVAPTTELWPWSDSLDEYNDYKEVLPKIALTEFWSVFGPYSNDLQESVEDSSRQIKNAQSQGLIPTTEAWTNNWIDQVPKDVSTQLFSLFNSISSAQSSLNDANQKLSNTKSLFQNAQNLGLVSKDNAQTTTAAGATTKSNDVSGKLNSLQNQLNNANQKIANIQNIYSNAQNLGLVAKQGAATPSELWALPASLNSVQGNLNSVNQKLNSVQGIYSNAKNIGLTTKQNAANGYLNDAQSQINVANQKLNNIQSIYSNAQNLGLVSRPGASASEFWSLSDTLDKVDPYVPKMTELWSLFGWFSSAQDKINTANQKLNDVKNLYNNAQNLGLVAKEGNTNAAGNTAATTQPTQLWSKAVENVEQYKEFLPVEVVTGFWQLFGSVANLEDSVADAKNQIQEAQEKGVIPSAETAETWSADWTDKVPQEAHTQLWSLFSWFSSAQTSLDTANQKLNDVKNIYNNAQQLGLITKENTNAGNTAATTTKTPSELWGWSHEVSDLAPSQLWSLWSSLNDAQSSLNAANQKLQTVQNMQQNAKNLGLIGDQSTTSTGQSKGVLDSLSDANSKLQSVNSMQQSAKNLGLISDQSTTSTGQSKGLLDNLNDANAKLQSINNIQQSAKNLGLIKDQNTATTSGATPSQSKSWTSSLSDVQSSLNAANQKLANVQSIYQNAQNLGFINKQNAASNKLWAFSGAVNNVQNQLNTANQKIANVKSAYQNAQNLGLVTKENATPNELWSLSNSLDEVDPYIPKMTELWSFWGWLTSAQDQVNSATQKINNVKNIYNNAQNLGLIAKDNANNNTQATTATPSELWSLSNSLDKVDPYIPKVTELWSLWGWLTSAQDSLNTANQKVATVKSIYQNAQNIGLVAKENSATPANSAKSDAATPAPTQLWNWSNALDEESDFKTPIPRAVLVELWGIFGSLSGVENSVQDATQQIEKAKREFEATQAQNQNQTLTPEAETMLWNLFGKLSNVDTALGNATHAIQSAQDRGVIPTPETVDAWDSNWLDNVPKEAASELWGLFGSLNNLDHNLADTKSQLQGVGVTYQGAKEQGLVGKEGELTRLFWPFTKTQTVQDKAKSAFESARTSFSNAGTTIGDKAKSAYASSKTSVDQLAQKASETAKTLGDKAKVASEDAKNAYATGKNVYNTGKNVANVVQNQPQTQSQQEGQLTEMFWPFTKSETVQDKAKNAFESTKSSLNTAGSTVQDKAKSAYAFAKTSADEISQRASETAKTLADRAKTASEDAKNAYATGKTVANTVQNQPPQEVTTELFWPFTKSETVQDKAKNAFESTKSSVSSAGSDIQNKAKSAYDFAKSSAEELSRKTSETAKTLGDKAKVASKDAKNAYTTGKNVYNTGKAVADTVQNQPPQDVTTELFWPFTKSETVQDKAKNALEFAKSSLNSAGSTVQDKAKSAYASTMASADELSQKTSETAKTLADRAKTASEDAKNAFNTGKTVANAAQSQPTSSN